MRKSKNFAGNSDCDTINVSPNPSSLKIAWVKSSLFSGGEVVKVQQKMKCTRWNMCQELFSTKASFTFRGFDRLIGPKPMGLSNWNTEHFFLKFLNGELDLLVTLSRETLLPKIGHLRELCEGRRVFCPAQQYQRSFSTQIPLDNWTLGQLKGGTILTSFQIGFDREYSIYGKSWFWSLEKVELGSRSCSFPVCFPTGVVWGTRCRVNRAGWDMSKGVTLTYRASGSCEDRLTKLRWKLPDLPAN